MQGHIYLKSSKLTLNKFLAAGIADADLGANALLLLDSISVKANDTDFHELFCFLTAFQSLHYQYAASLDGHMLLLTNG